MERLLLSRSNSESGFLLPDPTKAVRGQSRGTLDKQAAAQDKKRPQMVPEPTNVALMVIFQPTFWFRTRSDKTDDALYATFTTPFVAPGRTVPENAARGARGFKPTTPRADPSESLSESWRATRLRARRDHPLICYLRKAHPRPGGATHGGTGRRCYQKVRVRNLRPVEHSSTQGTCRLSITKLNDGSGIEISRGEPSGAQDNPTFTAGTSKTYTTRTVSSPRTPELDAKNNPGHVFVGTKFVLPDENEQTHLAHAHLPH